MPRKLHHLIHSCFHRTGQALGSRAEKVNLLMHDIFWDGHALGCQNVIAVPPWLASTMSSMNGLSRACKPGEFAHPLPRRIFLGSLPLSTVILQ